MRSADLTPHLKNVTALPYKNIHHPDVNVLLSNITK